MDKRTARSVVYKGMTFGTLRRAIQDCDRSGVSVVNPELSKDEALTIFERAIAGRNDDEAANPGRDEIIAINIVRETGCIEVR